VCESKTRRSCGDHLSQTPLRGDELSRMAEKVCGIGVAVGGITTEHDVSADPREPFVGTDP
jgi:hypothetical protein